MVASWQLLFTKQAQREAKRIAAAGLRPKAEALFAVLQANPYQNPPPYEKLLGDLDGAYSLTLAELISSTALFIRFSNKSGL